ncbi:MAG TPA: glycosyltransferase [Vicinamibacterales bacterium]|nr:glycosyltransferase [Vicinamibacterales bacterium]
MSAAVHFAREDGLDLATPVTSVQDEGSAPLGHRSVLQFSGQADRLLSTLAGINEPDIERIVVDDGSTDGTGVYLRDWQSRMQVRCTNSEARADFHAAARSGSRARMVPQMSRIGSRAIICSLFTRRVSIGSA